MALPKWLRSRVPDVVRYLRHPHLNPRPLLGLGQNGSRRKFALVSYLTGPLRVRPGHPDDVRFSNVGIARNIVRALNDLGYVVDLVQWDDAEFVPTRPYELFLGHGGANFERFARALPPDAVRIYFSTGTYWKHWNQAEEERLAALEKRRGVRLPAGRRIEISEEYANQTADGIICLGNDFVRNTYARFPCVINLNNAAYPLARRTTVPKDFAAARKHFLFFSGGGNVHKGLDLLLEAFSHADAHLWVCQYLSPEFAAVYSRELQTRPNIHNVGFISMRQEKFYELADRCAFVIHPTCAEGQPGSVIECMHHGLIPVLSRAAAIDTADLGVTLSSCSVDEIARKVTELRSAPVAWCEEMSRRTRAASEREYSQQAFLRNFTAAVQQVIARKRAGGVALSAAAKS